MNPYIGPDARVSDNARVYGDARVYGNGDLASTRHCLTVGPIGSENRTVTTHRHYDGPDSTVWGHLVNAGCWSGTLDDIDRWRADYQLFIAFARHRIAEWEAEPLTQADHDRWANLSNHSVRQPNGSDASSCDHPTAPGPYGTYAPVADLGTPRDGHAAATNSGRCPGHTRP